MAETSIEWATDVWNPITGCDRVSPGCDNCYALTMAKRLKGMGSVKYQQDGDPRTSGPGFGLTLHGDVLDLPLRWRKPRRVFVNSMSDLFHDDIPDDFIAHVFAVMAIADEHTFQVLTKRHGRMRSLLRSAPFREAVQAIAVPLAVRHKMNLTWAERASDPRSWPLRNIWLGVSVEDQKWANIRIPALLETPAAVRWISAEPLLGPIVLADDWWAGLPHRRTWLDWVVVGGESGPGFRSVETVWVQQLRDQCISAGVPFFFKQWGGSRPKAGGRELDGRTWDEYPEVANGNR